MLTEPDTKDRLFDNWPDKYDRWFENPIGALVKKMIFRSPDEIRAIAPVGGLVKTAIHFQKDDDPEMATEIEAIRLLNWEAAWMVDSKKGGSFKHTYLALSGAIDLAMMVTDRAVQILGGHGYIREHPVELWMRNGRGIATLNGLAMV